MERECGRVSERETVSEFGKERECGKDWDGEREDESMRKRERMCV